MTTQTDRKTMNGKPVFTVPSNTIINFDSGFKPKLLCDGPTFTAGTACPYSCSFCYVPAQMLKQEPWLKSQGVEGKHENVVIRRQNAVEVAVRQIMSKSEEYRNRQLVIYASPLTDVAANMELVRETVDICEVILKHTAWQIRLLSKSNLLPKIAQAFESLKYQGGAHHFKACESAKERIIYGVSTGTLDDELAGAFEAGTPKVSKRLESLHWLQDNGYRTFGMICPSLPQEGLPEYSRWAEAVAKAIRAEKCEHVWAEVINLRGESFTRTVKALRDASFEAIAFDLERVSADKEAWEEYSRATFEAHIPHYRPGQLRFLQYVNAKNRAYWESKVEQGAVLL